MTNKSDAITEIMMLNPTVGAAFLAEFSNEDLFDYLQRLRSLASPNDAATPPVNCRSELPRFASVSHVTAVPA